MSFRMAERESWFLPEIRQRSQQRSTPLSRSLNAPGLLAQRGAFMRFRTLLLSLPRNATPTSTRKSSMVTRRNVFVAAQWIFAAAIVWAAVRALRGQWSAAADRLASLHIGWIWILAATA